MAFENIQITYPNFCLGPQTGTFCTIDRSAVTTKMVVKNDTGASLGEYTLSSNIVSEVVCFEYVGPSGLSAMIDGLTFFTVERVSSSTVIIKRWETRVSNSTLNLKQQRIKTTSGNYYYDILSGCVEKYEREFSLANPGGINYLEVNSAGRIAPGMRLFLGPSNDADNLGATETATVSYVSGTTVYLLSNLSYQYIIGDSISFYNNLYLFSNRGYGGSTVDGSLFQLNLNTGNLTNSVFDGQYKKVTASRWSSYMSSIGAVMGMNMIFLNPYNYFSNDRSINLNNIEDDKVTIIPVEDIVFKDDGTFYKLMDKVNMREDDGDEVTESWDTYNYQADTLFPYTNCVQLYTDVSTLIGGAVTTDINIKVIDQLGVGLLNVPVTVSISAGDPNAVLDPLDGQVTTDSNGEAVVEYTSGATYEGATLVKAKAGGGSANTGSTWVWEQIRIFSDIEQENYGKLFQIYDDGEFSIFSRIVRQIANDWELEYSLFCKTYFTHPGGDWINPSANAGEVATYLPHLHVGVGDGPQESFEGWDEDEDGSTYTGRKPLIKQVAEFEAEYGVQQAGAFESYNDRLRQIAEASHDLQVSQLKMAHHTSWVDGVAYDELFTDTAINQFIFVDDAIPVFWSEKNPKDTNIWIRLRPYAHSLDASTLVFKVREISYAGDTGYVDMASYLTISTFDAGGGLNGLEITCDPPIDFHHNGLVYVKIEVYDLAPTPNFIWVYYWFGVIPDYRFPYLDNLNPSREQENVPVDSSIYFEIKDLGVGVDISTFEMTVNSVLVSPSVTKINDNFYSVTYDPPENFGFEKTVAVNVKVADSSDNANYLNDGYRFYTPSSSDVWFTEMSPEKCVRGVSPYSSVRFVVLGNGNGVDRDTIRLQILERDKTDEASFVPIIYRIS